MSFEAAQSDLVGAVEAAAALWVGPPALLIEYPNRRLVDVDRQPDPYVCVEVEFFDGGQISMGASKWVEEVGTLTLVVHTKVDGGWALARRIMDHFTPHVELKNFTVARTRAARAARSQERRGWNCTPLVVPVWFHRLVS